MRNIKLSIILTPTGVLFVYLKKIIKVYPKMPSNNHRIGKMLKRKPIIKWLIKYPTIKNIKNVCIIIPEQLSTHPRLISKLKLFSLLRISSIKKLRKIIC